MEKKENLTEFILESNLYEKYLKKKDYKLPVLPLAIIRANAPLDQKRRFKKCFKNTAGIYGWIYLPQSLCYVGSSSRLHVRPWQHVSTRGSTNKNFKLLWSKENLENFVLVIFEILGSSEEVNASLMESKENLYLQQYIPLERLLNVLLFAYTYMGYKHSDELKQSFSLSRKGKKGHKRPDITGALHPIYGLSQEKNPFFGKKHTTKSLQKISEAARHKTGFKSTRGCAIKLQNVRNGQTFLFATKTEAAKFLGIAKPNTLTQYIQKSRLIQETWFCLAMTKEDFIKVE